jgi:hypothetical protein
MAIQYVNLPLYDEEDYFYYVPLERTSYKLRIYYNSRIQGWILDLMEGNDEPIVMGMALVPNYPIAGDYLTSLTGFFWLEAIGAEKNETIINPYELWKYYRLFYIYEDGVVV